MDYILGSFARLLEMGNRIFNRFAKVGIPIFGHRPERLGPWGTKKEELSFYSKLVKFKEMVLPFIGNRHPFKSMFWIYNLLIMNVIKVICNIASAERMVFFYLFEQPAPEI